MSVSADDSADWSDELIGAGIDFRLQFVLQPLKRRTGS